MKKFFNPKGFTLIELLVVIAVLGIVSAAFLAAINPLGKINKAKNTTIKSSVSQLVNALQSYYSMHQGIYPAPTANTWITTGLVNNGELKGLPPVIPTGTPCTNGNAVEQNGYCYQTQLSNTEAMVYAHLESYSGYAPYLSIAYAASDSYFLWYSGTGKSGAYYPPNSNDLDIAAASTYPLDVVPTGPTSTPGGPTSAPTATPIPTSVPPTSTPSPTPTTQPGQTPVKTNFSTGIFQGPGTGWTYTMGYRFKVNNATGGKITALWDCSGGGTRILELWSDTGGPPLRSVTVTSSNRVWMQGVLATPYIITPADVAAGTYYRVTTFITDPGGGYWVNPFTMSSTYGNITIDQGLYGGVSGDVFPGTLLGNYLYGIPDITYIPN